jgi:hypothetical protein
MGVAQRTAFEDAKSQLKSSCTLTNYDPELSPFIWITSPSGTCLENTRIEDNTCHGIREVGGWQDRLQVSENGNTDGLSRLESPSHVPEPGDTIMLMDALQGTPVTATHQEVDGRWTNCAGMATLWWWLLLPCMRWTCISDGSLLGSCRVVVYEQGQSQVLAELHLAHLGVLRMRKEHGLVAKNVEASVKKCPECQLHEKSTASAPLHPWEWLSHPWAWPCTLDHSIPDAFTMWLEVVVPSTSSCATINALRPIFATHGLPDLTIGRFYEWWISQVHQDQWHTSCDICPISSLDEWFAVQTFKAGLKRVTGSDVQTRLTRFLFLLHHTGAITPHSTTGVCPSEILKRRHLRSHLDLSFPSVESRVHASQGQQDHQTDYSSWKTSFLWRTLVRRHGNDCI